MTFSARGSLRSSVRMLLKSFILEFVRRKGRERVVMHFVAANVAFGGEGQVQCEQMSPVFNDGHSQ